MSRKRIDYPNGDYIYVDKNDATLTIMYSDGLITAPHSAGSDGLTLYGFSIHGDGSGPWDSYVYNTVFDFRDCPLEQQDEVVSLVCGARVCMKRCAILGGIKAILAGNGEYPNEDEGYGWLSLEQCFIGWSGRRCPEAKDGLDTTIHNCWVHNWGSEFDTKAFGAYADRFTFLTARQCLFTQSAATRWGLGPVRTVKDIANHVGHAFNEEGWRALFKGETWVPGIARGLTGRCTTVSQCYRNRPWIRLGPHAIGLDRTWDMGVPKAASIALELDQTLPPLAAKRLGMSFGDLFWSLSHR